MIVFDENDRPGGQLFKQIHKFFGSQEHRAKERGFNIGNSFLNEAKELGVEVSLNSVVLGIYENGAMNVMITRPHRTSYGSKKPWSPRGQPKI